MMQPHEIAAWNAAHPVGTPVEVRQAVGSDTYRTHTAMPLRFWGGYELLALASGGSVTLDRVRVLASELPYSSLRQSPMP